MTFRRPVIAAFDFDGTLTNSDTLLPFLLFAKGKPLAARLITKEWKSLILYLLGLKSRQATKEAFLTRFFKDEPLETLQPLAARFAKEAIPRKIKPEALKKLRWHQARGDRCILISASIDLYLTPFSQEAGFQDLICSELEISPNGQITGRLKGLNCWGPEKTRRLTKLLGPRDSYTLFAYGDSPGDKELLALADHPFFRSFG